MTGRVLLSEKGLWLDGTFVLRIVQAVAMDLSDPDGALGLEFVHPCNCEFGCSFCRSDNETGERVSVTEVCVQESDLLALALWSSRQQVAPTAPHTQAIADKLAVAFAERRAMVVGAATERSPQHGVAA